MARIWAVPERMRQKPSSTCSIGSPLICHWYRIWNAHSRAFVRRPISVPAAARATERIGRRPPIARSVSTSSTAARAASAPLFSGPGTARRSACAASRTVSTPKATGTPVSRATAARPEAASRATCS